MNEEIHQIEGIELLPSHTAIRRRPQLFVGPLSGSKLANALLYEAFCCARDEARAGNCTRIEVWLDHAGTARVRDNGPGLPLARDAEGQIIATRWLTELHACSAAKSPELAHTLCGPGLAVLNALSQSLTVHIHADAGAWTQSFVGGVPVAPMCRSGAAQWQGTQLEFQLDRSILGETEFDFDSLVKWTRLSGDAVTWCLKDLRAGRSAGVDHLHNAQ